MAQMTTGHAEEHGLRPRQYILIGLTLTVITAMELWVSYSGLIGLVMIPLLIILSAIKFSGVVAFFMHLRFENSLMARVFLGSLLLATVITLALLGLFWGDLQAAKLQP